MPDINVEQDLNMVNDQIGKLAEELNKLNGARDNIIQQLQNLSGVAMYLRGKMPPAESPSTDETKQEGGEGEFQRSVEYPNVKPSAKK